MREKRQAERGVVIPEVVNLKRRESCRLSLWKFGTTYFAEKLTLKLSEAHREIVDELQYVFLHGGQQALAAPRGFGKDFWFEIATLWAELYGHCKYVAYGGPRQEFADDALANIKHTLETNELLFEDFPEVCAPIRALERAAQRAKTQFITYGVKADGSADNRFTYIEWSVSRIVFPTVWQRDAAGKLVKSKSSGAVIRAFGLEGGARGLNTFGMRPDVVVVNDLQNEEIAKSDTMKKNIEEAIDKNLGGLAGPGVTLRMFMLCTIIRRGDLADKYTDPQVKPAWRGRRYKTVIRFPDNMDLWQEYMEMRREGQRSRKDPEGRQAHKFYLKNRKAMDAAALVIWPDNFARSKARDGSPMEVSALQHAMNEWCDKGDGYFWSELQNEPIDETEQLSDLKPELVASRTSGYDELLVPDGCTKIVEGIDIGSREIHYRVWAYEPNHTGYCIEYGRVEVPGITENEDVEQSGKLSKSLERRITNALRLRREETQQRPYFDLQGNERYVDLHLVDSGSAYADLVYRFVRESGNRYLAIKGDGRGQPGAKVYSAPQKREKNDVKVGDHWYGKWTVPGPGWLYHIDTDYWKEFTVHRWLQNPGEPGSATQWGSDPRLHRIPARHACAEYYDPEKAKWIKRDKHNHYFDCDVYAHCGARMLGIRLDVNTERVAAPKSASAAPLPAATGDRVTRRKKPAW